MVYLVVTNLGDTGAVLDLSLDCMEKASSGSYIFTIFVPLKFDGKKFFDKIVFLLIFFELEFLLALFVLLKRLF